MFTQDFKSNPNPYNVELLFEGNQLGWILEFGQITNFKYATKCQLFLETILPF